MNGWLITVDGDCVGEVERYVVQEGDDDAETLRRWQATLCEIIDAHAPTTSRYSPLRLRATLEPGESVRRPQAVGGQLADRARAV